MSAASGVGAGATLKVDSAQLGKKLGKHVEDFGDNASNAADRRLVINKIQEIGVNPDKIVSGVCSGQGPGGKIGPVFFRIKASNVVVTKPNESFFTILKYGVIENTFVKSLFEGAVSVRCCVPAMVCH